MKIAKSVNEPIADYSHAKAQPVADPTNVEGTGQQGINFRPLLRTLRRNAWLILGTTALTTGLAYWVSRSAEPVYQGNLLLLVEPVTPERSLSEPGVVARGENRPRQTELDYATQLVVLQSSGLLEDIVEQVQASDPAFDEDTLREGLTIERCCSGTGVAGTGGERTKIIEVIYRDTDPERTDLVLDITADRLLQYSLEERTSSISEGVRFIDDQLPFLETRVSLLQSEIQSLQEQNLLTDPEIQGNQLSTQLAALSNQKLETDRLLGEQITLYQNLQRQLGLSPSQALASSTLSEDPGYQNLLRQREEIESQIAVESAFYSEASPVIKSLREQERELSSLQERRAREVLGSAFNELGSAQMLAFQNSVRTGLIQQMVDTMNEIQVLEARSNALEQAGSSINQQMRQFPAISRRYAELQRELDLATQTLDRLLTQRETLRVEAAQNEFPWDLVSMSQVPRDEDNNPLPEEGELPRNMALGLLAGLIAGTGGALLRDKSKDTYFGCEDVEESVPFPLLSTVPYCEEAVHLQNASGSTLFERATPREGANLYSFLNSFSSAYAKIRLSPLAQSIKSIVVCSPSPQDGKSTVVVNLARAATMAGQRVLVVDANAKSPQLHHMLGIANSRGLSDVLSGLAPVEDVIESVPSVDNLFVLTAGQVSSEPGKWLASNQMKHLVDTLHDRFDLVIYDTPSHQEASDASFLASYATSSLMVIADQKTSRSTASQMIEEFEEFGLPCMGVIVNYA